MESISYEQVCSAISPPPTRGLVDLFNALKKRIKSHPKYVSDENPFEQLQSDGNFCISATSIQSKYIAFVLGKHSSCEFPPHVIQSFFEIDNAYKLQYGNIPGRHIDGCICLIHQEEEAFDLGVVYEEIYA